MNYDEKKSWAEELLRQKSRELGRIPKKDDFDEWTRSRIKAFLGPWPRALEAAGLKPPKKLPGKPKKRRAGGRTSQPRAAQIETESKEDI